MHAVRPALYVLGTTALLACSGEESVSPVGTAASSTTSSGGGGSAGASAAGTGGEGTGGGESNYLRASSVSVSKHACAVLEDGRIACWGDGEHGTLGDGTASPHHALVPVIVPGIEDATSVAAGVYHTCATLKDGTALCWGSTTYGAVGNGVCGESSPPALTPTPVVGLSGAVQIEVQWRATCALLDTGQVACWGEDLFGTLPDPEGCVFTCMDKWGEDYECIRPDHSTPKLVADLSDAVRLAKAEEHVCVLTDAGLVKCWGNGGHGRLGDGVFADHVATTPILVAGLTGAVDVAADWAHTIVLLADGTAVGWGYTSISPGALAPLGPYVLDPTVLPGVRNAQRIATSMVGSVGVTMDAGAVYWGEFFDYLETAATATVIAELVGITQAATSGTVICVRASDGVVRCAGENHDGELGDGTQVSRKAFEPVHAPVDR